MTLSVVLRVLLQLGLLLFHTPDAEYHVTIRAINDIDFGGPLALTVCHSVPYIIDTTPPVLHEVTNIEYDEDWYFITAVVNAT